MNTEKQKEVVMLKTKDIMDIYKVHINTVLKWRKRGMPHIRIANTIRYNANDVSDWLEKFKRGE